jgi:sulfur-carrier protein
MARLTLTQHLDRFVAWTPQDVPGDTVGAVLEAAFADCPALRDYMLDDQGRVRQHVMLFVDGELIRDRTRLTDPVRSQQEIFVMQALSGG